MRSPKVIAPCDIHTAEMIKMVNYTVNIMNTCDACPLSTVSDFQERYGMRLP